MIYCKVFNFTSNKKREKNKGLTPFYPEKSAFYPHYSRLPLHSRSQYAFRKIHLPSVRGEQISVGENLTKGGLVHLNRQIRFQCRNACPTKKGVAEDLFRRLLIIAGSFLSGLPLQAIDQLGHSSAARARDMGERVADQTRIGISGIDQVDRPPPGGRNAPAKRPDRPPARCRPQSEYRPSRRYGLPDRTSAPVRRRRQYADAAAIRPAPLRRAAVFHPSIGQSDRDSATSAVWSALHAGASRATIRPARAGCRHSA